LEASKRRIRVVYDCMIFLQATARRNSPAGLCLELAEKGVVDLCVSSEILYEVSSVLCRPKLRTKFPKLTDELVAQFIGNLRDRCLFFEEERPS
jgi:predicted nucleic acid-binding protein